MPGGKRSKTINYMILSTNLLDFKTFFLPSTKKLKQIPTLIQCQFYIA